MTLTHHTFDQGGFLLALLIVCLIAYICSILFSNFRGEDE